MLAFVLAFQNSPQIGHIAWFFLKYTINSYGILKLRQAYVNISRRNPQELSCSTSVKITIDLIFYVFCLDYGGSGPSIIGDSCVWLREK